MGNISLDFLPVSIRTLLERTFSLARSSTQSSSLLFMRQMFFHFFFWLSTLADPPRTNRVGWAGISNNFAFRFVVASCESFFIFVSPIKADVGAWETKFFSCCWPESASSKGRRREKLVIEIKSLALAWFKLGALLHTSSVGASLNSAFKFKFNRILRSTPAPCSPTFHSRPSLYDSHN